MGLTDVPRSFEQCATYIEDYEAVHMAPTDDNALIADGVFALYASTFPSFLAPAVRAVLISFMDSKLSNAFKLTNTPSDHLRSFLCSLLTLRKFFVRHLMLPRYKTLQVFGPENESGYRSMAFWEIEPWYVASSKSCSWVFLTYARMFGLPIAGDDKFRPEGYKLHEIGPKHLEGKGGDTVRSFVKDNGASSFTTFGQFQDVIYTRNACPLKDMQFSEGDLSMKTAGMGVKVGSCPMSPA